MIPAKLYAKSVMFLLFSVFFMGSLLSGYLLPLLDITNSYDLKRVLVLVFIVLVVLFVPWVEGFRIHKLSAFTWLVLGCVFVIGAFSGLQGQHPWWSLLELLNFALLLTLFFILAFCSHTLGQQQVLTYLFYFALFFSLAMTLKFMLLLLFHFVDGNRPDIHSLVSGFMNVRFFNQLQSMLMPILCLAFLLDELKPVRRWAIIAFGCMWLMLLQSEARGAVLALVVALFAVLYFLAKDSRQALGRPLLFAFGLGTLLWLLLIVLLPLWLFNEDIWQLRTGSSGRIEMWLYILSEIPKQPLTGFGPMSFAWAEGKPIPHAHPHNSLLQFLYEYGVLVFALVSVWVFLKLMQQLRLVNINAQASEAVLTFALCSGFLYSLFCGVIVMPLAQLLLTVLIAVQSRERGLDDTVTSASLSRCLVVAVLVLVVVHGFGFGGVKPSNELYPRYWSHGLLPR